ncbi:protein PilX [Luteimonas sp. MC1825]|nr:protein PilX [Luteimonas sp. MC1825]QOC89458.1 protein PilX [Luteimonas sp. MC1825]
MLYVALIMLVLLTLIGIVAMQVAGLQERMSANYQAGSMAFQNAEAVARGQESSLKSAVTAGSVVVTSLPPGDCVTAFDAEAYTGAAPYVRRLDMCFSWGALDYPADESEKTDQIYQITAFAKDRAAFASSESVIDTVFIP